MKVRFRLQDTIEIRLVVDHVARPPKGSKQ